MTLESLIDPRALQDSGASGASGTGRAPLPQVPWNFWGIRGALERAWNRWVLCGTPGAVAEPPGGSRNLLEFVEPPGVGESRYEPGAL